jgi:hypothetical protein
MKLYKNRVNLTLIALKLSLRQLQLFFFISAGYYCPTELNFTSSFRSSLYTDPTFTMKFVSVLTTLFATLAVSSPVESHDSLLKRQAAEACSVGYCTQNGGTTGGAKGQTVTVTSVAALIEAAKRTEPLTIIVSGKLTGSDSVRPTSDKTIIGAAGSCKSTSLALLVNGSGLT